MKKTGQFRKYVSLIGVLLAAAVALFMFTGCSTNSTGADEQIPPDNKINYLYETAIADDVYAGPGLFDIVEQTTSKVVGLLGGTIKLDIDGATSTFTVPAGALLRPTEISLDVKKFNTPLGPIFVYDCGPDGTKFKSPSKLTVPMSGGQENAFLYYFNEESKEWELQEVAKVKDGVATFNINHFSKYGIS